MAKREAGVPDPSDKPSQRRDSKGRFSYGHKQGNATEDHHDNEPDRKPPHVERDETDLKH